MSVDRDNPKQYKIPANILLHGWDKEQGDFIYLTEETKGDNFRVSLLSILGYTYALSTGQKPYNKKGPQRDRETDTGMIETRRIFTTLYLYTKKIRVGKKTRTGISVHRSDIVCPDGRDPEEVLNEVRECLASDQIKGLTDILSQLAKGLETRPVYRTPVPLSVQLSQPDRSDPKQLSIQFQEKLSRTLKAISQNPDYTVEHQVGADLFTRDGKPLPFKADHYKLINAIRVTLGELSGNISKQDGDDFYRGNLPNMIPKGDSRVSLQVSITHLARNYGDGRKAENKDIKHVEDLIRKDFENPKYWIVYEVSNKAKIDGLSVRYSIPELAPIVRFQPMQIEVEDHQGIEKETTEILSIHPLFAHQIENKYAVIPRDLNDRLRIAWEKPRGQISVVAYKLFEILLMGTANPKRIDHEEGVDKLFRKVHPKYYEAGRIKLIREQLEEAIEAWTRLGLIGSYRIEPGGPNPKYVFELNRDWCK